MMEDHILGNLHNELFSINSEDKYAAFQSMARSLTYSLFIKILLKTAQLSSMHFALTPSHSLYPLSFFIKARILLQFFSQAFLILYMFPPFSFVFINALMTSNNLLTNMFFSLKNVSPYFYFYNARELSVSL